MAPIDSIHIRRDHFKRIEAIHDAWVNTSADNIELATYRDAMIAYRRELIARITAIRDRTEKHGLKIDSKRGMIYGDE